MLEYPSELAKNKHDLVCHKMSNNSTLQDAFGFENTGAIFQALSQEIPKGLATLANVYSYQDAPNPPLSRSLIVIGVADTALSVVRKLVGDDDDDGQETPDCLHKCLVAVKRADGDHLKSLEKKYIANSKAFGTFMQRLRSEGLVAILALDKYQRFGILKPVPLAAAAAAAAVGNNSNGSHGPLQVQDCFATIHVGNVNHVKSFLRGNVVAAVAGADDSSSSRPQTPPVEEMDYNGGGDLWQPPGATAAANTISDSSTGLWQPPGDSSSSDDRGGGDLWKPPGDDGNNNQQDSGDYSTDNIWGTSNSAADALNENKKRPRQEEEEEQNDDGGEKFHANAGAAAADKFYSGLKRTLDTRADSYIYHMRSFNGWVKATQIQELDPKAKDAQGKLNLNGPMRILDLACGKGGDLGKWVLHPRGLCNYVGSDVARGSLQDAAIRVRGMRQKLKQCTFTCADLGHDVPGRLRSAKHKQMQKLLTWSLQDEKPHALGTPEFKMVRGGGIGSDEKFDVVSIQFAIHYMIQTRKRARRFFRTVSELLEVGGNLICTTMDARVVVGHLLNLGLNYHFDDDSWNSLKEVVVKVGGGACRITFEPKVVKKIFTATSDGSDLDENLFGLEYTFTLVEGSDHEAGVGDAVNLAEWLIPIPVLTALGKEAGLEIEYAKNFHEFYADRSDPSAFAGAHSSLYNMKVLNRNGSLSKDEWEISRLYAAIKFRKVREPTGDLEESDQEEEEEEEEDEVELDPKVKMKLMPMAMMKAKKAAGADVWSGLSSEEKKSLIEIEVVKLAKAG